MKFAILITTKNRLNDLIFTIERLNHLLQKQDVECIICDDGSEDGTFDYISIHYPTIQLFRNKISKGLIYSRNKLLERTSAEFAISIDDDSFFITKNPLELIENYFDNNSNCGLIAFRIFWGKTLPEIIETDEKPNLVRGFVGCGHVWRMTSWKSISPYPEWFIFYGEEDFASYELFKQKIEIHYLPTVLVQHNVDVLSRKNNIDYRLRQRRSFRSGWYLYFLFCPWKVIPRKLIYTLWIQIKSKTLKGDFKATIGVLQAIGDVVINFPKLLKKSNRFSSKEYSNYLELPPTKLYWNPKKS